MGLRQVLISLFTSWQVMAVGFLMLICIPGVFYLASIQPSRPRPVRKKQRTPAKSEKKKNQEGEEGEDSENQ